MSAARNHPQAALLGDGRVLVIGDDTRAEVWDPETGAWTSTASLNHPRTGFAAVALEDGRVLVTGGVNDIDQSYSSAYVFDSTTDSWTKVGLMDTARTGPMAALLPDGRVLVAGGYFHHAPVWEGQAPDGTVLAAYHPRPNSEPGNADIPPPNMGAALATAELFDPATGAWSATGPMRYARYDAAVTTLSDGRILIVGSKDDMGAVTVDPGARRSSEIYDPATGRFTLLSQDIPPLTGQARDVLGAEDAYTSLAAGTLVALPDGNALLIGAQGGEKHGWEAISRSFRLDVASGQWSELVEPAAYRYDWSGAEPEPARTQQEPHFSPIVTTLSDGRVLVAGGSNDTPTRANHGSPALATSELYDPIGDSWSPLPAMPEPRQDSATVVLDDGSVLVIGGGRWDSEGDWVELASVVRLVVSSP